MKRCHLRLPHHSSNVVQIIKQKKECHGESAQKKVMEEMNTPKPNNNLALAIFTTVCCCLPAGIYAIIRAMKVNEFYMMKQYDEAVLAANDAKKWSLIGIVAGVIGSILYLVCFGGLAALGAMTGAN